MRRRRDVRSQFTGEEIDEQVLLRVLTAGHLAPSVGLSQPWDFVLVRDRSTRASFREHVERERERFAASLPAPEAGLFERIKIEGILDSSIGVVVAYDASRGAPHVLGRYSIADAGLYSVCLAIENMWLAATAEGLGIGWVSFYEESFLARLVGLPDGVRPVAWLCLGPVTHLEVTPDLERAGWRERLALSSVVHEERYGRQPRAAQPSASLRSR